MFTDRVWLAGKDGSDGSEFSSPLSVFTRTPEAMYGVSHICVSPAHSLNDPQYYKACRVDLLSVSTCQVDLTE